EGEGPGGALGDAHGRRDRLAGSDPVRPAPDEQDRRGGRIAGVRRDHSGLLAMEVAQGICGECDTIIRAGTAPQAAHAAVVVVGDGLEVLQPLEGDDLPRPGPAEARRADDDRDDERDGSLHDGIPRFVTIDPSRRTGYSGEWAEVSDFGPRSPSPL